MRAFKLHKPGCRRFLLALVLGAAMAWPSPASSAEPRKTPSGLPVPRFVSLKEDRVNVREGPSKDYPVLWIYTRKGLPVEVIAEHDIWRRIRDKDGAAGWVHGNLLDGGRMAIVEGVALVPIRAEPEADARPVAWAEPGLVLELKRCIPVWCEIEAQRQEGWIERARLWGLYADEIVK